jgi:hypothetical protein
MLKLVFSSHNKKRKYVVFFDCARSMAGMTCRSFENIDEAINFAYNHNDMWIGNIHQLFVDRINELNHPIMREKRSF